MLRNIKEFKGNCLIIGGGWKADPDKKRLNVPWRNKKEFYTVDIDKSTDPDLTADIRDSSIVNTFGRRFDFIYFECIPLSIVSVETLKIAHQLLTDNGVFLFRSGKPSLEETIPASFHKAGFIFSVRKALQDEENDKVTLSLAANQQLTSKADIKHLSIAAQNYIEAYGFFSPTPWTDDYFDKVSDALSSEYEKNKTIFSRQSKTTTTNQVGKSLFSINHRLQQTFFTKLQTIIFKRSFAAKETSMHDKNTASFPSSRGTQR